MFVIWGRGGFYFLWGVALIIIVAGGYRMVVRMHVRKNDRVRGENPKAARRKRPRPLLPRVVIPMPRCPYCEHFRHFVTKTLDNGDDSVTRWVRCRNCRRSFVITSDPSLLFIPGAGIVDRDDA